MANLITDGSLVGFWPLNEPSGTPIWQNYSPAFGRAPSGIGLDLTVAVADASNLEEFMSVWPGQGQVFNAESGTWYTGYQVQGAWKTNTDSSPLSRYLVLAGGSSRGAQEIWQPAVANSGFTVGFWVYPNSDGNENMASINTTSFSWETEAARCHTLVGAFQSATNDAGWHMGISGVRSRGAQFDFDLTASKQLRAFAFIEQAAGVATDALNVPIESGRFTHIAYSFRYINGTVNEIVLYKDGRVAASGTTSANLTASNGSLITNGLARTLAVGCSDDGSAAVDDYERTSGWNHLVSGLYFFKRVLHEGEMLEMHERGGLQPSFDNVVLPLPTRLTSDYLIAYYPFMEPGYADITSRHLAANSNYDAGGVGERVFTPGPYGFGGVFHNGTNTSNYHAAPSGACFDMLANGSWTFGTWCSLNNLNSRNNGMFFSWGAVTSVTNAVLEPASSTLTTGNTAGIVGTVSGIANQQRIVVEVYPRGSNQDPANTLVFNLLGSFEYYNQAFFHVALAYDDATKGVAAYINGHLAESGTLNHSLTDQLRRLAGSGYPLIFGNGVQDGIADAATRGLHTAGGIDNWLGPAFLASRALAPAEVRGIVLSGILDLPSTYRTRHDPRLVGYWPCSDYLLSDVMILDEARVWNRVPGNLVRGDTLATDERWYDVDLNDPAGSVYRNDGTARIDHFGSRTQLPALASYGNLGITSGIFVANAGSVGTDTVTDAADSRSSYNNPSIRYKPVVDARNLSTQNLAGEYVVAFEVTPSGNIPAVDIVRPAATNAFHTNCLLFAIGNQGTSPAAGDASYHGFLTSLNALAADPVGTDAGTGPSGVIIKIMGSEDTITAANQIPLVSGRLPFGVPSKVLVHTKFDDPFSFNGITAGQSSYTVSLWINGVLTHRRTLPHVNSRIWSDSTIEGPAASVLVQFGGVLGTDTYSSTAAWQAGLGDIYMREIYLMKGVFLEGEIAALASSGIQSPSIAGFTNQKPTTQVTIADADLQAYWRFNGFDGGGSGTTDLSFNNNHLFPAAQRYQEAGFGATQSANYLRFAPAMFADNELGVQCSGISHNSLQPAATAANRIPVFMASGAPFENPNLGFSIGFMLKKKELVVTSRFDALLAYGLLPTSVSNTALDLDFGWTIGQDDNDHMKMVISTSGNMYLSNTDNAAMSGQVMCGVYGETGKPLSLDSLQAFDRVDKGGFKPPRLDSWSHYCWTYDPSDRKVRCYLNGDLIDVAAMKLAANPDASIQIPADPTARYITFLQHSTDPWTFTASNIADFTSVLADVFYFTRPLTEAEVRYVALNGIDNAVGTPTSGVIGGFVHGQDTGSGLIGGYQHGQDTGSGLIGAYIPGSVAVSGLVGGYVSGIIFGTGTVGGFLHGMDTMSGIAAGYIVGVVVGSGMVAGYIHGQDVGSGLFGGLILGSEGAIATIGGLIQASNMASGLVGGYMLGGLQGRIEFDTSFTVEVLAAEDFDAQLEVAKTASSDFDAKLIIFQNEMPPLVSIIIPDASVSGLMPPFNQYFIGVASGQQGKTITQTRWNFGDFTPSVSVSESGAGYYPTQHYFAASGFYIVRFEAIDSDGLHASATRIVNAASGIDPVLVSLSGVPRSGDAGLVVDFSTTVDILPPGVSIVARLLAFDDGQTTTAFNPTHVYTEPGTYKPVWCVRDSRGITWCDSLEAGNDFLTSGGA